MSTSVTGDLLFKTVVPLAKFKSRSKKTGKTTEQLCTLNNYSRWGRFGKAEIKAQYKSLIQEFFIPEPDDNAEPLGSITLVYSILRHNKRKIDSDNIIHNIKWISDLLQDMGWISDDDQVTLVIRPSIYIQGLSETQFQLMAYISD